MRIQEARLVDLLAEAMAGFPMGPDEDSDEWRRLARVALQASPDYVTKITHDDGRTEWVKAVGEYTFAETTRVLGDVERERRMWETRARRRGWKEADER